MVCRGRKREIWEKNSLGGNILVLDAAVHEGSQGAGRLLDVGSLLGDGELLEELVKNLDGLGVLGRHYGGCWGGINLDRGDVEIWSERIADPNV